MNLQLTSEIVPWTARDAVSLGLCSVNALLVTNVTRIVFPLLFTYVAAACVLIDAEPVGLHGARLVVPRPVRNRVLLIGGTRSAGEADVRAPFIERQQRVHEAVEELR